MENCVENKYPDEINHLQWVELKEQLLQNLNQLVQTILQGFEVLSVRAYTSVKKQSTDPTMYVGSLGTLYGIFTYSKFLKGQNKEKELKELEEVFDKAIEENIKLVDKVAAAREPDCASFLMSGPVGLSTLICLHLLETKPDLKLITEIIKGKIIAPETKNLACVEAEILYGAPGYLYSLLTLEKQLKLKFQAQEIGDLLQDIYSTIVEVVYQLVQNCSYDQIPYLQCKFPSQNKRAQLYVGAAHGTVGILYMMMRSMQTVQQLAQDQQLVQKVLKTLEFILQTMESHQGLLPTAEGSNSMKFHFCHGAPGTLPMLMLAAEMFPSHREVCLKISLMAGEATWKYGLLLKGNGLCHGISGNGYFLHSLSRGFKRLSDLTDNQVTKTDFEKQTQLWRTRSFMFAKAMFDGQIQNICKEHPDQQRKVQGVSDHPFSLMEGTAGDICFLSELLNNESEIRFPSYEI